MHKYARINSLELFGWSSCPTQHGPTENGPTRNVPTKSTLTGMHSCPTRNGPTEQALQKTTSLACTVDQLLPNVHKNMLTLDIAVKTWCDSL